MKKAAVAFLALALLMMFLAVAPAVSAKTLKSDQVVTWQVWPDPDPDPRVPGTFVYYSGPVDFGGGMTGTSYYAVDPTQSNVQTGKTSHFYEYFYIAFDDGGWILGNDNGVYNYQTNWMYMANGWVIDASANYEYLIGCKYHAQGKTTDPFADVGVGTGAFFLAGA